MKKNNYNVIGVMSGTSLDGVDLAHITFNLNNDIWSFEIIENETISYSKSWIYQLKSAVDYSEKELATLNTEYTKLLGSIILKFIKKHKIEQLDAVCSHGHTILHQPEKGLTLQFGNLPLISTLINQTVVCDFRVPDVKLGGQGAPLVPIGDQILFSNYDYCINLGGFSNISFEKNNERIAFDISPVNTVLNYYANQIGQEYDDKGQLSRTGEINEKLLDKLNNIPFYGHKFPKSLGFEFVKGIVLPIIESYKIPIEDKLRTFTEHVALQIPLAILSFESKKDKKERMLITGGGAYNDFLIEKIQFYLPEMELVIPSPKIVEFKEALIFALLGVLKLRDEINVLKSVTGAKTDHSSGIIYKN